MRKLLWSIIIFIIFVFFTIILTGPKESVTGPVGWEKSFYLSPGTMKAAGPGLDSKGKFIAVVFEGKIRDKKSIYCSLSFNGGLSFIKPIEVADSKSEINTDPSIAISSRGKIVVMWQDLEEKGTKNRMFISRSSDMGKTWSKPAVLSFGFETEILPRIFFDSSDNLHLFFHAYTAGAFNLFHALSREGEKFSNVDALMRLTPTMRGAFFPSIYLNHRNIYMVWQAKGENFSDDIFFMSSPNSGRSWSSPRRITSSTSNDASPSLLFHDGILYCVYQNNEQKDWAIKLIRGYRGGERWDPEGVTVSTSKTDCYAPKIVPTGEELLIAWHDSRQKKAQIVARKFYYREQKFSDETVISSARTGARNPLLYISGKRAGAVWEESGRIAAKNTDVYASPPVVVSDTHPQDRWTRNVSARIKWIPQKDDSGIVGYATIVNNIPDFNPTIQNIKGTIRSTTVPNLDDGITYFHIRAIDGAGNFSRTVHYPLKVSQNPLPMPVVVSTTHPQSTSVDSNNPVLKWALDDTERLKGFVYSLTKEKISKPETFIDRFEINFKNLEEGRYYFTLAAVDKTDSISEINTYNFIVGKQIAPDTEYLTKIAKGIRDLKKLEKPEGVKKKIYPSVDIEFPATVNGYYTQNNIQGLIKANNIYGDRISGYSVIVSDLKSPVPERINFKSRVLNVSDLKNGTHVVGIKMKYLVSDRDGKKVYRWTKPVYKTISVSTPEIFSPLLLYARDVNEKMSEKKQGMVAAFISIALMLSVILLGRRFPFYLRLLLYRFRHRRLW